MTIGELSKRFTEHQKITTSIPKLIPSYIVNIDFSDVLHSFSYSQDDLSNVDRCILKVEFDIRKFYALFM